MSARRITSKCASWLGRGFYPGVELVVVAGVGAAEAGTGVVGFGVDGEVAPLARLVCRPLAEKTPDSLGRLRGRGEPSIKGVPNFPGREAGLLAKAEKSLAVPCMSWSW